MEWITAALAAFVLIVPVELPDKTFIATLVLTTRYPPLPVWLGVVAAFGIQCAIAVAAGQVLTLLPDLPVRIAVITLFVVGAIVLARGARGADAKGAEEQREYAEKIHDARTGWRAAAASFAVLFAAEWGDLSQLLIASLVAGGRPAVPVFVGAWMALSTVAGAGVLLGRVLLRHVRLSVLRYVGAGVCTVLAVVSAVNLTA